jgi:hypothetical protein
VCRKTLGRSFTLRSCIEHTYANMDSRRGIFTSHFFGSTAEHRKASNKLSGAKVGVRFAYARRKFPARGFGGERLFQRSPSTVGCMVRPASRGSSPDCGPNSTSVATTVQHRYLRADPIAKPERVTHDIWLQFSNGSPRNRTRPRRSRASSRAVSVIEGCTRVKAQGPSRQRHGGPIAA